MSSNSAFFYYLVACCFNEGSLRVSVMSGKRSLTNVHINALMNESSIDELEQRLASKLENPAKAYMPTAKVNAHRVNRMWQSLGEVDTDLLDSWTAEKLESFDGNIENCIGSVKVPLGIAGPLRVNGLFAQGDYTIPLATSETALVTSYHQGACARNQRDDFPKEG